MVEGRKNKVHGKYSCARRVTCSVAGFIIVWAVLVLGSDFAGASDVQLKYSPRHMMNSIPHLPSDLVEARIACSGIREMAGTIDNRRSEAERIAGDDVNMEKLVAEIMARGNIQLLQEVMEMERTRVMAGAMGPAMPRTSQQQLDDLSREFTAALNRVGEGLPLCHMDEKAGEIDRACIERNNRTIRERQIRAANTYLHGVQTPLMEMQKETRSHIEAEEAIMRVESGTESSEIRALMMQHRIVLIDMVRGYIRNPLGVCVNIERIDIAD